jgi:hypothetical protein
MSNLQSQVNWQHGLHRWDAQQSSYLLLREERFQIMLEALATIFFYLTHSDGEGLLDPGGV